MPFRVPSADPGRIIFLICCIAVAGLGPLYVWWNQAQKPAGPSTLPSAQAAQEPGEELLALRAENQLLLAMLGAVESRVIILGPTQDGAEASGKIAWDEARQAGYLHLTGLPPAKPGAAYQLTAVTRSGTRIACGALEPTATGTVATPFEPEARLLGAERFEVVLTENANGKTAQTVVLRGGGRL